MLTRFFVMLLAATFVSSAFANEVDPSQKAWYEQYGKRKNAPQPADMLINTDAEPDLKEGFRDMFNGKDLEGWKALGGTCKFEVRDGMVVGTCVPGSKSTYLSCDKKFTDFVFTCDIKWEVDGNTGVMFRSDVRTEQDKKTGKEKQTVFGPQAEMEGIKKERYWNGGIYAQSCGGYYFYPVWLKQHADARAALKRDHSWNRLTISAKGNVIKTWVNGVPVAHWVDDGTYAEGFFGLQIHSGKEGTVWFKDVRVKELK